MRHLPEHNEWGPNGRCDVVILEPDGSVTRCGYARFVQAFDLTPDPPKPEEPRAQFLAKRVAIGVAMAVLGAAILLDWYAFVLYVSRNDIDPRLAVAFIFRMAASFGYGAACAWLWRRR